MLPTTLRGGRKFVSNPQYILRAGNERGGDMARRKADKDERTRGRRTARRTRRVTCLRTGKIRYRDGHDAALALEALRKNRSLADIRVGSHTIRVKRKYACASCGGWHLTSWADASAPALAS